MFSAPVVNCALVVNLGTFERCFTRWLLNCLIPMGLILEPLGSRSQWVYSSDMIYSYFVSCSLRRRRMKTIQSQRSPRSTSWKPWSTLVGQSATTTSASTRCSHRHCSRAEVSVPISGQLSTMVIIIISLFYLAKTKSRNSEYKTTVRFEMRHIDAMKIE